MTTPPARARVPELVELGLSGVSRVGSAPGVAQLVWGSALDDVEGELTFAEGFAQDAEGGRYAWELWTLADYEATARADGAEDVPIEPLARLQLAGPDEPPVLVLEPPDLEPGPAWTQLVVDRPSFTTALLERLWHGADDVRAWCFTAVPPGAG